MASMNKNECAGCGERTAGQFICNYCQDISAGKVGFSYVA